MLKHVEGYGGEDKALNVGKNKWDQPVGPTRSRGGDLSWQGDLFQAYLQECWQWGIYNKTPKSLTPTSTILSQEVIRSEFHQKNKPRK